MAAYAETCSDNKENMRILTDTAHSKKVECIVLVMFDCDRRNTGRRKRHEEKPGDLFNNFCEMNISVSTPTYLLLTWNINSC
jgi:hypothetical protein